MSTLKRNSSLDVLRGIAVLLVLVFHAGAPDLFPEEHRSAFARVTSVMWGGVDLFFVLSGFLISGLLFKEMDETGTLKLGRFWLRRGLKIWPSYFAAYGAMLALTCAVAGARGDLARVKQELVVALPNAVFVQNYLPADWRWPNSWSLAVEEHFYLALPALLLASRAWSRRRKGEGEADGERPPFPNLLAAGAAFCALVLAGRFLDAGTAVPNAYFPTHFRADSLCVGVMLGWLSRYRRTAFEKIARPWPLWLVLAPLALAAIVPLGSPWPGEPPEPGEAPHSGNYWSGFTIGFTILYLGFAPLVAAAGAHPDAVDRAPRILRVPARVLAFVGVYSYTIYLAQAVVPRTPGFFAMCNLGRRFVDNLWTNRAVFVCVSLVLGIVLSHVVERPVLKLRERWIPSANKRREARAPVAEKSEARAA